jgi:DUF1365 family protein
VNQAGTLYRGNVLHRRLRPCVHTLRYRVLHVLVDIDRLDELARNLRFFAHNRCGLFAFHDRDYGAGDGTSLRPHVERLLQSAGIASDGGAIHLLTMPRLLGYAFNPLSTWFCHGNDGALRAIIYEVSNTFGERHSYVMAVEPGAREVRHTSAKRFHVSPFLPMDMDYAFRVLPPVERLAIGIVVSDSQGPVLSAIHTARREDMTDAGLLRAALVFPLVTLKVTLGIHWEALKLLVKRVPLFRKPPPPKTAFTSGS